MANLSEITREPKYIQLAIVAFGVCAIALLPSCNGDSTQRSEIVAEGVPKADTTETGKIAAGSSHSCGINSKGALKCWGDNRYGALGTGTLTRIDGSNSTITENHNELSPVTIFSTGASSVSTSIMNTCAVVNGAVYCWGEMSQGIAGPMSAQDSVLKKATLPRKILDSGAKAVRIVGSTFACALVDDSVHCWGSNLEGMLGIGKKDQIYYSPQLVLKSNVESIASTASGYKMCAIRKGGALYCWGHGFDLNDPFAVDMSPSLKISSNVAKVAVGMHSLCAMMKDTGSVKCWGKNGDGEAGVGNIQPVDSPTEIFPSSATWIAMDHVHMAAVVGGSLYETGRSFSYVNGDCRQFQGNGSLAPKVTAAGPIREVSLGASSVTCALFNDGLKCKGENSAGQLGIGNTTCQSDFVPVLNFE